VIFNDALDGHYFMASMIDKLMSMEHWWNETDKGNPK